MTNATTRTEDDRQNRAEQRETDTAEHAPCDGGAVDVLIVKDVGNELDGLEWSEYRRRRERQSSEVNYGEGEKDDEPDYP